MGEGSLIAGLGGKGAEWLDQWGLGARMFLIAGGGGGGAGSGSLDPGVRGRGGYPELLNSVINRVGPEPLSQGPASRPFLAAWGDIKGLGPQKKKEPESQLP